MRRKSERNKTKGSPEKKVEKPTRKSTRRRGKRSPSTSPEQENVEEAGTSAPGSKEPEKEPEKVQTRLQAKEQEQVSGETETEKVTPVEREGKVESPEDEEENNGRSVWKVARADASPGEIQKLKLCRQRNASEASSDASVSRKKSNKWQESGEGVAEEVDSADEQLVSCTGMRSGDEPPNDPSSSYPGQDSNEEVSDSKEILPETTSSANLSDDKPNIDQQGVSNEANTANQNVDSEPGNKPSSPIVALAPSSNGDYTPEENNTATTTTTDAADADATTTTITTTTTTTTGTPAKEEKSVEDEKSVEPFSKEASVENVRKDSSTDDEDEDKEKVRRIDSSSDSNDETNDNTDKKSSTVGSSRASRRKHRNKYRDSSNSETPDSEDEPSRERKVAEKYGKEEEEEDEEEEEEETDAKDSREAKERSVSPKPRSNSVIGNTEVESDHCEGNKQKSEISNEKLEYGPATVNQTSTYKPAKVNLKRSFSTRMLMERTEAKREDTDTTTANETNNQDKENHNSDQQPKCVPRKRRWGTALSTDTAPSFSISTDSLKALVPGAKPLPINEVRLSKDDDEERERYRGNEKWHGTSDDVNENKVNDDGLAQKNGATKKGDAKMDNHIAARRKISIVKETPLVKSPSPPATKPTNILLIKNLVRPFTLNQIKELLSRTGTIVENGFWMDRIKSKCFVEYANEDQAFETRQALHGISWPVSNPKRLHVDYATKDDMELARELSKDQPIQRKTEPLMPSDSWQQEWGRDERTNATKVTVVREWDLGKEDGQQHMKEKEREKKEQEKKRRQRSRSPALEAHLPAPARKFKKKEDEPPPAKLLDDLFRKTKATPCIYWLPLTNEQIVVKEEMRRQHMAEHARRLEEMRRAERNRDGRRRRSPRK